MAKKNINGVVALVAAVVSVVASAYTFGKDDKRQQKILMVVLSIALLLLNVVCFVVKNKTLCCSVCIIVSLLLLNVTVNLRLDSPEQTFEPDHKAAGVLIIIAASVQSVLCLNMMCAK